MQVRQDFPHAFTEVEHSWIPTRDGTRLAARIWLPQGTGPAPAIVEYIPYRKRWGTRTRDEPMHRYFAGHGYAVIRIDLRGSGESEGLLTDEYTAQEQQDGLDALAFIAAQPWCNGRIGMLGKSWGGFNALQIAALRPPQLGAVIAVCASDDRYADDAHYMGGCLLTENLIWGSVLFTLGAQPPDPDLVPDWRAQWRKRLDHLPLYAERWLRHPTLDEYWQHGSVATDWECINCPVFAVSGWADGYSNAVPRMLANLQCPRKGLIGPWAHLYPHEGIPGPAIGFLQEALRWFDHWLRGRDTGIMREPPLRAWMQEYVPPQQAVTARVGRWVAEDAWPSKRIRTEVVNLGIGTLRPRMGAPDDSAMLAPLPRGGFTPREIPLALRVGQASGAWCGFGVEGDQPGDQREDDSRSLCLDLSIPARFEVLGAPVLRLTVSCDRPFGQLVARLCDVAADGSSLRVSYGVLNLRHRHGHSKPQPLVPDEKYQITLPLNDCGHAFMPGHTLRVAFSASYWPLLWPESEPFKLTLHDATLELPVRPERPEDAELRAYAEPESAAGTQFMDIETPVISREVSQEGASIVYRNVIDAAENGGPAMSRLEPIGLEIGHSILEEMRVTNHQPGSARIEITQEFAVRRPGWDVKVRTEHSLHTQGTDYVLRASVEAWEHDIAVFSRLWDARIPRFPPIDA